MASDFFEKQNLRRVFKRELGFYLLFSSFVNYKIKSNSQVVGFFCLFIVVFHSLIIIIQKNKFIIAKRG